MQSLDEVNADIDAALKDGPPRSGSALILRGTLKKVTTYVRDFITDYATRVASAAGLWAITSPTDGLPGTRYTPILELPASTGGTYDFADIQLTAKPWDGWAGGQSIHINLYVGNRGGLIWEYTIQGNIDVIGLEIYQQADGRVIVYVRADSGFRAWSVRVPNSLQATIYPTLTVKGYADGALKMSTLQPLLYRPLVAMRSRFTTFVSGNCDGAYPADVVSNPGMAQMALGANMLSGVSEMDLLNTNSAGSGFAFWQMTAATVKKLLAYLDGNGNLNVYGAINAKYVTSVSNPTTSDITDGNWSIRRNTTNNEVRLWVNVGGVLKSTLLS